MDPNDFFLFESALAADNLDNRDERRNALIAIRARALASGDQNTADFIETILPHPRRVVDTSLRALVFTAPTTDYLN